MLFLNYQDIIYPMPIRVGACCAHSLSFQKNLIRQNNRKGLSVNLFYARMPKKIFAREMAYPSEMETAPGAI